MVARTLTHKYPPEAFGKGARIYGHHNTQIACWRTLLANRTSIPTPIPCVSRSACVIGIVFLHQHHQRWPIALPERPVVFMELHRAFLANFWRRGTVWLA